MGRTLNGEIVSLSVIETPRAFPATGAPAAETTVGNSAFNPELTTFLHSTVPMSSTLMYPVSPSTYESRYQLQRNYYENIELKKELINIILNSSY